MLLRPTLLAFAVILAGCGVNPRSNETLFIAGSPTAGQTVAAAAEAAGFNAILADFTGAEPAIARFCGRNDRDAPDIVALGRAITLADATACAQGGVGYDTIAGPGGDVLVRRESYRQLPDLQAFAQGL